MYNPNFTFRYLKTRVTIGDVLAAYGLDSQLKRRNDQLYGPCPLHHGDNPTAFRVHLTRGLWRCFTACGGGDIVDLMRCIENCSYAEAARHLYRLIDWPRPARSCVTPAQYCSKSTFFPFRRRIPLNPRVPFLQDAKKISISTAINHEAGTTVDSSFLRGTVAVRLHDLCGQPLGYCGRHLYPDNIARWGKWRFPKGFPKGKILYNAHRAQSARTKGIVVVECPWAAMRLTQAGMKGVVSLLGTSLSFVQEDWLSKAPAVLLMLDGDDPGRKAALSIARALCSLTSVFIYNLPDGLEPEDLSDSELMSIVRDFFFF